MTDKEIEDMFIKEVLDAMQNCEEIGGPTGQVYLNVMARIAAEAGGRYQRYNQVLEADKDYDGRVS